MNQDSHPAEAESERTARDTHPAFLFWERYRLDYVALILAVFLVWGHSVSFQFVWDDAYFIENLQNIRSLQNLPQIFYSLEAQSSYPERFKLFRPLRTAHYAVLTFIGGGAPRPWLFHLANLLWHCGPTILFYKLLCLLIAGSCRSCFSAGRKWWPLLRALAFAVHPVVRLGHKAVSWDKPP